MRACKGRESACKAAGVLVQCTGCMRVLLDAVKVREIEAVRVLVGVRVCDFPYWDTRSH
jgi:hypothetical protein